MSNGVQEVTTELAQEGGAIMAEAITHPVGFLMLVCGIVAILWAYGKFVKTPDLETRIAILEAQQRDEQK